MMEQVILTRNADVITLFVQDSTGTMYRHILTKAKLALIASDATKILRDITLELLDP